MKKLFTFITLLTLFTSYTLHSQWYKQQVPVNKPITGIKFTDTLNGWAVTYNYNFTNQDTSYVLHTTDGGNNWLIQFTKIPFDFETLYMVDNTVGYISGDSVYGVPPFTAGRPHLFKTTNGGVDWNTIPLVPNMAIDYMQFLNRDTGWECQQIGTDVRVTTDGGLNWLVRTNGINAITTTLFFLNYNTGFCGAQNNLYKTMNAGMNWNQIGSFVQGIQSIYFINENTGWLGFSNNSRIRFTSNGGLNWLDQQTPPIQGTPIYDLLFFNSMTGYAGYGVDKIFKTINGGLNWGYQIDTGGSLHITFADTSNGWTSNFIGITNTKNGGGIITYVGIAKIGNSIPDKFKLFQNYPNPFNSQTSIRFSLNKSAYIDFKIYDESGKELNPWIFGWEPDKLLKPGKYELQFDGKDMASGTYFFRLIVTDANSKSLFSKTIKMILIK